MKEFRKHWNKEIRPYIHNPKDREIAEYWWRAAFENIQQWIMGRRCDMEDVLEYINKELEN